MLYFHPWLANSFKSTISKEDWADLREQILCHLLVLQYWPKSQPVGPPKITYTKDECLMLSKIISFRQHHIAQHRAAAPVRIVKASHAFKFWSQFSSMWVTDLGGVKLVATWTVLMLKKNLNSPPDYLCILAIEKVVFDCFRYNCNRYTFDCSSSFFLWRLTLVKRTPFAGTK